MSIVLVSGASSGVGAAIAARFSSAGHQVLALGRDAARLAQLAELPGVTTHAVDMRDREALAEIVKSQPIDVLVNNAGMMPPLGPFQDADQEAIDAAIEVNFTAQVALTRLVVPGMVARGAGHVFFTGSTAGHASFPNLAIYGATKAALGSFAQALRLDLSASGVRVTEIVAGRIESGLYRDVLSEDARKAMYAGGTAVQPEDVAAMVSAVLDLPQGVNVARFDILPTRQTVATGTNK